MQYRIVDKHSTLFISVENSHLYQHIKPQRIIIVPLVSTPATLLTFVLSFGILVCVSCSELAVVIVLKCTFSSRRKLVGQRRDQNSVSGRSFVWMEDLF